MKSGISLTTPRYPKARFKVSHLYYASIQQPQYEATVKHLGSFRLSAGRRHLYRHCIFTEQVLETVSHSLRHSCTSELTRQGNTLYFPFLTTRLTCLCTNRTLSSSSPEVVRCLAFGLLLARSGLHSISRGKVTMARLFNL
jgi:hypothetical protein